MKIVNESQLYFLYGYVQGKCSDDKRIKKLYYSANDYGLYDIYFEFTDELTRVFTIKNSLMEVIINFVEDNNYNLGNELKLVFCGGIEK